MRLWPKKAGRAAAAALCCVALAVALRLWYLEEQGNFHPVAPGQAYRSAQLDRDELEGYVRAFGIRSVINLRGKGTGKPWYEDEVATCHRLGVGHFDLGLSSSRAPSPGEVEHLLALFNRAPRPVLIHCRAGADRSGLAAALWQAVVDGLPASVAGRQLSLRFGHLPLGPTRALDAFFESWMEHGREAR